MSRPLELSVDLGKGRRHAADLVKRKAMADPLITLTTDFGQAAPYVAAMKGVILGINPAARLVDLSHQIPPQDVRHADHFLAGAIPYFPPGVIHVVVVDPGVGTERKLLYVELGGHRLLLPDNGCWTLLARQVGAVPVVRQLSEPRFWREPVSHTFHGRDILAPVAAHLSLGADPALLGPLATEWQALEMPQPHVADNSIIGEVSTVDDFGNLITNIPATMVAQPPDVLLVRKQSRKFRWVRTYGEVKPGQLVGLISSSGYVEIAVAQGNAAQQLKAKPGTEITIGWASGNSCL
jgi:S-adenosyl-L-methionine hydrolase (adenosine-forming)